LLATVAVRVILSGADGRAARAPIPAKNSCSPWRQTAPSVPPWLARTLRSPGAGLRA